MFKFANFGAYEVITYFFQFKMRYFRGFLSAIFSVHIFRQHTPEKTKQNKNKKTNIS